MLGEYISTAEAAKLIKVSSNYIRGLCGLGRIKSQKFGHAVMVDKASLLEHKQAMDKWRAERAKSRRSKASLLKKQKAKAKKLKEQNPDEQK